MQIYFIFISPKGEYCSFLNYLTTTLLFVCFSPNSIDKTLVVHWMQFKGKNQTGLVHRACGGGEPLEQG